MKNLKIAAFVTLISLLSLPVLADAKPKEKIRKGKPADQTTLDLKAEFINDSSMKIDGLIEEWRGMPEISFETLLSGEYDYDWTGPKDLSAKVKARYGAERVYFLIQVKDNAIVGKLRQWKSDRVELWMRAEDSKGKALGPLKGIEFDMGPAVQGGQLASKWLAGGKKTDQILAKHYIDQDGYDIEIGLDYTALASKSPVLDGSLRFCFLVRDWDQDDANEEEASIGSCPIDPKKAKAISPAKMGKISFNLADAVWESIFRSDPALASKANWIKTTGNVGGTSMPEIIAFSEGTLVVAGFEIGAAGLSWSTIELASSGVDADTKVEVKNIHGDKTNEIIVTRHETCNNTGESMVKRSYVFALDPNHGLKLISNYITELYSTSDPNLRVTNDYKFVHDGVVQTLGAKSSSNLTDCVPQGSSDMLPLLKPEDGQKKRKLNY